jgi:fibro-slime domain-containing protein
MLRRDIFALTASFGFLLLRCGGDSEAPATGSGGTSAGGTSGTSGDASSDGAPIFGGSAGTGGCQGGACGGASPDASSDASGEAGAPYCGDRLINVGVETCDDGNASPGDGCSATCELEANFICSNPGQPCVSTVTCGDGIIAGTEQCDDRNKNASDGCSTTCQLEDGWTCPYPGLACVSARCGDGIVAGFEECDDGNSSDNGPDGGPDGCDTTCHIRDGFKCDTAGMPCTPAPCGNALREGNEQCDDGNLDLGDGCSPLCKLEPSCSNGPCVSACGDGVVLGTEACDDGNKRNGDGCADDCTIEIGFTCTRPPLPTVVDIPLVIRDFAAVESIPAVDPGPPADFREASHIDFEIVGSEPCGLEDGIMPPGTSCPSGMRVVRNGQGSTATGRGRDIGQPGETFDIQHLDGSLIATVSLAGKPVYAQSRSACDKLALPTSQNNWDKCTLTTMDADSFSSWYVDRDSAGNAIQWPNFLGRGSTVVKTLALRLGSFDEQTAVFTAGGRAYTFDSRYMSIDGSIPPIIANTTPPIRTRGFFPIDEFPATGSTLPNNADPHDFHFTSEVRFWFEYQANSPRLDFSGDDDVWVYVNGHLALDIGGIHGRVAKSITIDSANATFFGLETGKVYEIAVFQAERNISQSNYWLTLEGFNASRSDCESTCGDGKIASDELCDDGPDNTTTTPPPYGKCSSDCKTRGPHCGDARTEAGVEECDDGVNTSVYDFNGSGCAPGCVKPPRCGDAMIQAPQEQCDDGKNDGSYGGCTSACRLAARCGDEIVQSDFGEECDDGPAGSATCAQFCQIKGPH